MIRGSANGSLLTYRKTTTLKKSRGFGHWLCLWEPSMYASNLAFAMNQPRTLYIPLGNPTQGEANTTIYPYFCKNPYSWYGL
jgi:hypothetical protein